MQKIAIGPRLKELRKEKKLTLQALAQAAGTSASRIHDIEGEKSEPGATILAALARALSVSTDYLLGLDHPISEATYPISIATQHIGGPAATPPLPPGVNRANPAQEKVFRDMLLGTLESPVRAPTPETEIIARLARIEEMVRSLVAAHRQDRVEQLGEKARYRASKRAGGQ